MRATLLALLLLSAAPATANADAVNQLTELLTTNSSFKVRATAAVALGRLRQGEAIPPLVGALETDRHYAVRAAAASALGHVRRIEAVKPLLTALRDDDPDVRDAAGASLERYHRPEFLPGFRGAIADNTPEVREAAVRAYANALRVGTGLAAQVVFDALGDDDEQIRALAARAIATLDHERGIVILHDCIRDGESDARAACSRMLGERTDERSVDVLVVLLSDPTEPQDVRRAAAEALRAHKALIDLAATQTAAESAGGEPQRRALRVLGALREPASFATVEKALGNRDLEVRRAAARAAADFGGAKARAALQKAEKRERDPRSKKQLQLLLRTMR
jgi:HEAT repeat protein